MIFQLSVRFPLPIGLLSSVRNIALGASECEPFSHLMNWDEFIDGRMLARDKFKARWWQAKHRLTHFARARRANVRIFRCADAPHHPLTCLCDVYETYRKYINGTSTASLSPSPSSHTRSTSTRNLHHVRLSHFLQRLGLCCRAGPQGRSQPARRDLQA